MKKIIEFIKKLFGSSGSKDSSSAGFTLIELIIVIAILGVLAAAVLAAIDPIDKLRSGNDSKVQSDVRAIYEGAQRTAASGATAFPTALSTAQITELKAIPVPPSATGYGAAYSYFVNAAADDAVVCGVVQAKANRTKGAATGAETAYFVITGGKSCFDDAVCSAATTCP